MPSMMDQFIDTAGFFMINMTKTLLTGTSPCFSTLFDIGDYVLYYFTTL
jgi:hypothetical protein